ncbi:MAG: alpha/beta hydrolase [Acidimicrobiales bacterium]
MSTLTPAAAADLFRQAPERFLDTGRGEVAYRRVGQGPDVLFVHGWPVSSATFRCLLPHLVDHVTCHLVDLPGAGQSRFADDTPLSIANHVHAVRHVVDELGLDHVAVVGHDSGGMIARHALAGDPRVRAFGLIDTEQTSGPGWQFKMFLAGRHVPGFGRGLAWVSGVRSLRRNRLVLGGAFVDRSLLDGEFDEFFLAPIRDSAAYRAATMKLLKSFDYGLIRQLPDLHRRIDVPVQLVWGANDPFFPVRWAREMVSTFAHAELAVIDGAALFSHEERPAEAAAALLPVLTTG